MHEHDYMYERHKSTSLCIILVLVTAHENDCEQEYVYLDRAPEISFLNFNLFLNFSI